MQQTSRFACSGSCSSLDCCLSMGAAAVRPTLLSGWMQQPGPATVILEPAEGVLSCCGQDVSLFRLSGHSGMLLMLLW